MAKHNARPFPEATGVNQMYSFGTVTEKKMPVRDHSEFPCGYGMEFC